MKIKPTVKTWRVEWQTDCSVEVQATTYQAAIKAALSVKDRDVIREGVNNIEAQVVDE